VTKYDAVVVGGGIMGTATTRALARRGRNVLLLERFQIGHKRGSSHGASRIFRLSYPEQRYVEMAQDSLLLWKELEAECGERLVTKTGGFDTGRPLDDHINALDTVRVPYEILFGTEVNERWPFMKFPGDSQVLYQPEGGVVGAERAWYALARLALNDGAEIQDNAQVVDIHEGKTDIKIRTVTREVETRTVVVTAGAWAQGLLKKVGIKLDVVPTRETVAFFKLPHERFPTVVDWGDPSIYALPSPGQGIKVGEHHAGPVTDPHDIGEANRESVYRIQKWMASHYPEAETSPHHVETCIYTNTPTEEFVLERHEGIVVGSPCSGHGFKFAPWIGESLANLCDEILNP
jgi:sarcosine oxidase